MGCCRIVTLTLGVLATLLLVVGFPLIVYGTYRMQYIPRSDFNELGPQSDKAPTMMSYPFTGDSELTNYCTQPANTADCIAVGVVRRGYSRGVHEPHSGPKKDSSSYTFGSSYYAGIANCHDWYDMLRDENGMGDAAARYETTSDCFRSKAVSATLLAVFSGLVGLGLIPVMVFALFCPRCCKSCGNALLSAFVLIPIAIVLSVVFLASMASWGNAIPPLVNMYHCDGMDRSAYEDILGGIVLPNNAPELLQYDAVPNDCLTDLEGNQNNKFFESVALAFGLAVAGGVLVLLASVVISGIVVTLLSTPTSVHKHKNNAAEPAPGVALGPTGAGVSY